MRYVAYDLPALGFGATLPAGATRPKLLAAYSGKASARLDLFSPEERHQTYKKLRLVVLVHPNPDDPRGDLEVAGVLREEATQAEGLSKSTAHHDSTSRRRRRWASSLGHRVSNALTRCPRTMRGRLGRPRWLRRSTPHASTRRVPAAARRGPSSNVCAMFRDNLVRPSSGTVVPAMLY